MFARKRDFKSQIQKVSLEHNNLIKISRELLFKNSGLSIESSTFKEKPYSESESVNILQKTEFTKSISKPDVRTYKQKTESSFSKFDKVVFIDFETANFQKDSVCQIGIVVIENDQVVLKFDQLVKPEPCNFYWRNISIHHIDESMVKNAKTFKETWPQIEYLFNGDYLIYAHNASFDISSVLKASVKKYDLRIGTFKYGCTVNILKKITNYSFGSYRLNALAEKSGLEFKHHNALEDAMVTYKIVRQYCSSLDDFYNKALNCNYQYKIFENS